MTTRLAPSPALLRRLLHWTHAITGLALIATGLVIEFPDLRARLVGGYGREIAEIHNWIGFALMALPVAIAPLAARPLLADLRRRLGQPGGLTWRRVHVALSLGVTILLSLSGLLLWADPDVPLWFYDASLQVHIAATWVLVPALPVHLFAARHRIAASFRSLRPFGKEPDLGLRLGLDEEDLDPES